MYIYAAAAAVSLAVQIFIHRLKALIKVLKIFPCMGFCSQLEISVFFFVSFEKRTI